MRRIIGATVAVAVSSVLTVALGALRYKFVAIELGAPGVGLLGLLTSALSFAVVLFGFGLNTSGVQAVAAAPTPEAQASARAALLRGSTSLAGLGGLATTVIVLSVGRLELPAELVPTLGLWLGLSLAASISSGGLLALLNGTGRIRALAISNGGGAVLGTGATIAFLHASEPGLLAAALAGTPLSTLGFAIFFLAVGRRGRVRVAFMAWKGPLLGMLLLGWAVMLSLILGNATQLIVRVWVQHEEGLAEAGYFQAAWTVTGVYLGFVLTSLAAEYYPRISAQANEPRLLNESVDKQIKIALLLAAPVLLWMITLAPVVLHLLYAPEFQAAAAILRWQLLGDVPKIAGWALGFLLLARKARGAFFLAELLWNISYLGLALPLESSYGLRWIGVAYVGAYLVYLPATLWLAYRQTGFLLRRQTAVLLIGVMSASGGALLAIESGGPNGSVYSSLVAAGVTALSLYSLKRWRATNKNQPRTVSDVSHV